MPSMFRSILPKTQTVPSNHKTGDGIPNTTLPIFHKNLAPCANCSSAQKACLIHPPYSPSLCKKCAREHRDKCPAHMHRTDAVLWKRQELESKQASNAQPAPTEKAPVSEENPPTKGNANIAVALSEITPAATIQSQDGAELHESDVFEPPVSAFVEEFAFPPYTDNDLTPSQNHDEVVFNFNEFDQQSDLTAMSTTDDNFQASQGHVNLVGDDFEPHISGIVGDLTFLQFTDNDLTPAQNHSEVVFHFNDLDQQFDPNSMFIIDENFPDLFSPTEDDIQYLNANFDALWEGFE